MRLALLLALFAAAPVRAQDASAFDDATPDAVLAATWAEAMGGAEAVAWALEEAVAVLADPEDSVDDEETNTDAARALRTASLAAAGTAATVATAMQFSLALADPPERASVDAALTDDAVALHGLLVEIAETASGEDSDARSDPGAWSARAGQVRALAGRLGGAAAALGIADGRP
ncbi:MAG TPA: hypothetical protein VGB53_14430 [Rubricoccaceae bacterium]|jgi:hypothetical protein